MQTECRDPESAGAGLRATRAIVSLDALAQNLRAFQRLVGGASVLAVLKANAYGHGAVMAGRTVVQAGAHWLGVYTVEEGIVLRLGGIEAPILVFGPFEENEAGAIWRYRLTPTVTSLQSASALERAGTGGTLPFHLKLDTGLTRAGVAPGEALSLMRALGTLAGLRPQGMYTHFASAERPDDETTGLQLRRFLETVDALGEEGFSFPIKHAANTAAALSLPETHLDMVRIGIGLYGYDPARQGPRPIALQPALRLVSRLTRVHRVPAGTGVGYEHTFRCEGDSTIGLAPIGYGDGLFRALGAGRGRVIVRGHWAPIVGRVSMDQITLDLSDVPGALVGDTVTLVGEEGGLTQSADDLADEADTISYEVLTSLLPRVPRVYTQGDEVLEVHRLTDGPVPGEQR